MNEITKHTPLKIRINLKIGRISLFLYEGTTPGSLSHSMFPMGNFSDNSVRILNRLYENLREFKHYYRVLWSI